MKILKNNRPRFTTAQITCPAWDCKSLLEVSFYDSQYSRSTGKGTYYHFNCAACGIEIAVLEEDRKMFKPIPQ